MYLLWNRYRIEQISATCNFFFYWNPYLTRQYADFVLFAQILTLRVRLFTSPLIQIFYLLRKFVRRLTFRLLKSLSNAVSFSPFLRTRTKNFFRNILPKPKKWQHHSMTAWQHASITSWYHDIMLSCHADMLTSWHADIMTSWYHGIMASWHHGIMTEEHGCFETIRWCTLSLSPLSRSFRIIARIRAPFY